MLKTYGLVALMSFGFGVITTWILAGDPELIEVRGETIIDTVVVASTDTLFLTDTVKSAPVIKYIPKQVHDTIFIAEKVREYDTKKLFTDSAFVRHKFGIRDVDNILTYNKWDYLPAPKRVIIKEVEIKVYPSKLEKAVKTVGWLATGGGIAAIISNNVK